MVQPLQKNNDVVGSKGGGKGGGGGSGRVAREAPNTLQSNTTARLIDVVSEGEIIGLVDGLKSVFLDETPVQNIDDTYNFQGVNLTERYGTPNQTYMEGFPSIETEFGVGTEVFKDTPVIKTINDSEVDALRLKIRIPSLSKQNTTNGDLNGTSVEFKIEVQEDGGTYELAQLKLEGNPITVSGKTTSPYEVSYRFELPTDFNGAPWNIRVTRITTDSDEAANINNKTIWSSYTTVIDNKVRYVDTALMGIEVDAKQFGQEIPSRSYDIKGIKVKIPSNYDPDTRVYTGLWDGTFQTDWTDNPAWVLYDLVINDRYGLGRTIDATQIDKYALYEIAKHCDELIDDGYGGTEPRFTFNGVINTREDAYKVLNAVSSTFRGMLYWSSGLVTAVADKPADPVKLVTPANVVDGMFDYSGSSLNSRNSVAVVRYNDPDDFYRSDVVIVEDEEEIDRFGWKPKEVNAYGCTSKGQAFRMGKWLLDTERYSTEVVTYRASFDHADLSPGDIISVQDPTYAGIRYGGRVVSMASDTNLTLDDAVTFANGETYTLSVVIPNGDIETRDITNATGSSYTSIDIASAFSDRPLNGAMWTITGSDIAPRQFRVVSLTEIEKNIYEVSALFHDPNKYTRVETGYSLEHTNYSNLPTGVLDAPSDMSYDEYLYKVGPVIKTGTTISWTAATDPRVQFYELYLQRPDTDFYEYISTTSGLSIDLLDTPAGAYSVQVRSLDNLGNKSAYLTESLNLLGLFDPPEDITEFRITNVDSQAVLSWARSTDLDLSHYIVKFTSALTSPQWGAGTVLVDRISKDATSVNVPTLVGSYMIKAVDSSGVESANPASIQTNVLNVNQYNVVETATESPTFIGAKTNVEIGLSTIKLTDTSSVGYYNFFRVFDLGQVFTVRGILDLEAVGENATNTMDTWTTLFSLGALSNTDPANWDVTAQISTTDEDPSYYDRTASNLAETDISLWADARGVLTADAEDPMGGTDGYLFTEDTDTGQHYTPYTHPNVPLDNTNTYSVFVKGIDRHVRIRVRNADSTSHYFYVTIDMTDGSTITSIAQGNATLDTVLVEDYGDDWYRISLTGVVDTTASQTNAAVWVYAIEPDGGNNNLSYTGDDVSGFYVWGMEITNSATPYEPSESIWSAWDDFQIGDYTARGFRMRAVLTSLDGATNPLISSLGITYDMTDRTVGGEDILTNGSGQYDVVFNREYFALPSIGITAQDMQTGDYYVVSNKAKSGFRINFYNSSDVGIQRTFDWLAKGYGAKEL